MDLGTGVGAGGSVTFLCETLGKNPMGVCSKVLAFRNHLFIVK